MAKNSYFHFVIAAFLFIAAAASNITTDRYALLALKNCITHDPRELLAKNWSTSASVCNWIGVTCRRLRVTALDISGFDLQGTIAPQLGDLSSLTQLNLSNNTLSGTIPFSIFNASSLQILDLTQNHLSGSFPSIISILPSLQKIMLSQNNVSGKLPVDVFDNLPNLKVFDLSYNLFKGEIPATISKCTNMQYLSLWSNYFSGSIPKPIGNLTTLKQLYLGYNNLRGHNWFNINIIRLNYSGQILIYFILQEKFHWNWAILPN